MSRLAAALRREGCEAPATARADAARRLLPPPRRPASAGTSGSGCSPPRTRATCSRSRTAASWPARSETLAAPLLIQEGIVSPLSDNTLRPPRRSPRAEAVAHPGPRRHARGPAGPARRRSSARPPPRAWPSSAREALETHPLSPDVRLFRSLDGSVQAPSELILAAGEKVRFVLHEGRVSFLEVRAEPDGGGRGPRLALLPLGGAHDARRDRQRRSRATAPWARCATSCPCRLGVSGRVVEMAIRGSDGEMVLKGLKVRWALGLRENLFVVDREMDGAGGVGRFIFTGKGWGHGVGLCQVGAFGMAQAGVALRVDPQPLLLRRAPAASRADRRRFDSARAALPRMRRVPDSDGRDGAQARRAVRRGRRPQGQVSRAPHRRDPPAPAALARDRHPLPGLRAARARPSTSRTAAWSSPPATCPTTAWARS